MFSSNQIFQISGTYSQIETALRFAMDYSNYSKHLSGNKKLNGFKFVWQIAEDGRYCIGWNFEDVVPGWNEFQFDFDISIVSKVIEQQLRKSEMYGYANGDGDTVPGFLMKCGTGSFSDEEFGIKNPFYCIVSFEPYMVYFAK